MPTFHYRGYNSKNAIVEGEVSAETISEARSIIKNMRITIIKIVGVKKSGFSGTDGAVKLKALSLKEKIDFTLTFKTLHEAGVPIMESLVFIANEGSSNQVRALAREVRKQILEGNTFSSTIAKYPKIFDRIYSSLIKAGEDSGELDLTLVRLAELLHKQAKIKGKVISAAAYPVFILVLSIVIMIVMVMFMFPMFEDMFKNSGAELPFITKACIDSGKFMKQYWYLVFGGMGLFVYLTIQAFVWQPSREILDKYMIRLPVFGALFINANFSNYLSVLIVAYQAGIPIIDCLYLANLTLDNFVLREQMKGASIKVQQGTPLSTAFKAADYMPKMILFMIATGEQSGRLGELLIQAVNYIDEELDKIIEIATRLMEPLLIVVIGVIVGFMALAFYLPLFNMSQAVG